MDGKAPLRVLGETAYPLTVASARVRIAGFAPFLLPHRVDLRYRPALTDAEYGVLMSTAPAAAKAAVIGRSAVRATRRGRAHDLSLVHRLKLMSPLPGVDPPRRLDLYDIDDALFLGSVAEVNRRFEWIKQERRRCVRCLARARVVIAGNAFLADHARGYARRVEVIPSCVDPTWQPVREHARDEVVTVGWIGSRSTSPYLDPVVPVFAALNRARMRVKLVLIGADNRLRADWIEHRPWSLATEARELSELDIGIMPLPDTGWARGKCGYKLLQYFAAGVPAVASDVGVAAELVGAERGLLASSTDEWLSALNQLIADADERRERGRAARAFVERDYSYQRWAPELAALLHSLA